MGDYLLQVTDRRNLLWSVYLDNLQTILDAYHHVDRDAMSSAHRLADWAILVTVIADALGVGDVDTLFETAQAERAAFALEDEPWVTVLERWLRDAPEQGTVWCQAGDLLNRLEAVAEERGQTLGVTTPHGLGKKFATYEAELAELFDLEVDASGRVKRYRFADDTARDADLEDYDGVE